MICESMPTFNAAKPSSLNSVHMVRSELLFVFLSGVDLR